MLMFLLLTSASKTRTDSELVISMVHSSWLSQSFTWLRWFEGVVVA